MRASGTDDSSGIPMLESFSSDSAANMTGELPTAAGVSGYVREHSALQVSCSARGREAGCARLCGAGVLRLRRQARSRFFEFVDLSDSASSSRPGHLLHSPSLCCARVNHLNSCFGTHDAPANSWGTLHAARMNSGGYASSYRCTFHSCGGDRGGTRPRSMSTRGQGWCPAVEKLASLQQAPGRQHVETWAGRGDNPSLLISQDVEIIPRCADTVLRLPSPSSLFRVTWTACNRVMKGPFLTAWSVSHFLRVLVHMRMGEARLSGHNLESGAGHCWLACGGLSLP